ncbi:MAG: DUF3134 domain-containing protein [Scytonema sp. PMC 1069.18]|nr:DUF3134 domain-containing protein [Scytonema sp. PMC 1069.18]MEC4882603.1 DUF3134 domain-containing protein [Scytonema sp. PMC 1070.18]
MKNSPLREEPREKRAAVISSNHEFFLIEWLKSTGRLMERETQEPEHLNEVEDISTIIEVDDISYDLDDDDPNMDLDD